MKRTAKAAAQALAIITMVLSPAVQARAQGASSSGLRPGAKVFVNPMPDGFDSILKSALAKKKVPLVIVENKDDADFEIKGTSETQKAGAAKKVFLGSWHSDEQASISVASLKSGEIVFAYSANKKNSAHGKQTSAEACAKHLKEELDKKK